MAADRVHVDVPGSSANLGPGYDCLAVALPLRLGLTVERAEGPLVVEVLGEGAEYLPADADNLIARTVTEELGGRSDGLRIRIENGIPLGAGVGSSAAAIVAALAAADALRGHPLDLRGLIRRASTIEGHPDNVAASVLGGVTIAAGDIPTARRLDPPPGLGLVLVVSKERLATTEARAALGETVSRTDAVWNIQHASLLVAALATDALDDLRVALSDRLHEGVRAELMPTFAALRDHAGDLGALGVTLSGAGPSVLLWCTAEQTVRVAEAARALLPDAEVYALRPEPEGVVVGRV